MFINSISEKTLVINVTVPCCNNYMSTVRILYGRMLDNIASN